MWHEASHDEALARLMSAEPTADHDPMVFALRRDKPPSTPPGQQLCSSAIGICFGILTGTPTGSARKIEPRIQQTPWGSSFNR
jgi:hypothetical protein